MSSSHAKSRRSFLHSAAAGIVVIGSGAAAARAEEKPKQEQPEEEIAPPEDLMREHGVLNRILLIYEDAARRLDGKGDLQPAALKDSAGIIDRFIEKYHEKLEEDFLFPRFEKAGKLVDLTKTLRAQHEAGRTITGKILSLATDQAVKRADDRAALVISLREFVRMYRPHEAREDTVLFPALRSIVSANEFDSLGEDFEDQEHKLFGEDGFEKIVDQVASIEKSLGIYDLAQFTPKA